MATKRKSYTKLQCTECKKNNYSSHKSKMLEAKEGEQKIELQKFCEHCRKHTKHKEAKK